eukprot:gene1118-653_t
MQPIEWSRSAEAPCINSTYSDLSGKHTRLVPLPPLTMTSSTATSLNIGSGPCTVSLPPRTALPPPGACGTESGNTLLYSNPGYALSATELQWREPTPSASPDTYTHSLSSVFTNMNLSPLQVSGELQDHFLLRNSRHHRRAQSLPLPPATLISSGPLVTDPSSFSSLPAMIEPLPNYLRSNDGGVSSGAPLLLVDRSRNPKSVSFQLPELRLLGSFQPPLRPFCRRADGQCLGPVNYLRCGSDEVSTRGRKYGQKRKFFLGIPPPPPADFSLFRPVKDATCPRYTLPQTCAMQTVSPPLLLSGNTQQMEVLRAVMLHRGESSRPPHIRDIPTN